MNKVMLLYPPGPLFQRGEDRAQSNIEQSAAASIHACNDLGYCAAILKGAGYSVFLRDYQTEKAKFEDVMVDVLSFKPDIIFLSTTNATVLTDLDFVKRIKEKYSCAVFMKGAIFFNMPIDITEKIDFSSVECLIGGEVEFIILPLVNHFLKNEGDIAEIGGILYKKDGKIVANSFTRWNENLDDLPFPDRSLMNNALYVRPDTDKPMATISVARGCPSQCIYCLTPIISGKRVRFRSTDNIFKEIEECYYKYGISDFFFKADTFTIDERRAIELCDRIIGSDLRGKIAFTVNARADRVSKELLKKLKQAGCFMIAVGFESGSEKSLKLMKKNVSPEQNLEAARLIKQAGLPMFGFFMIGFPWEDMSEIEKTVKMIFKINPDFLEIHIAIPYYGTELYEACREYKTMKDMPYGFDYYNPNTTGSKYVSLEELEKIKKRTLLRFYARPSYVAKKAFNALAKPVVLKNYVKYGLHLIKTIFRR